MEVARQLCLLNFEYFAAISVREFLNCAFLQSNEQLYQLAANVRYWCLGTDARLPLYGDWVASQIIAPERIEERRIVFRRCVRIAHHCLKLNNLATARNLYSGISHRCVRRLRATVVGDFEAMPCADARNQPTQHAPTGKDVDRRGAFEARDDEGRWWPATVRRIHVDSIHVDVDVHDPAWRCLTSWQAVHIVALRRAPTNAKDCGDILPRGPGGEYEMYKELEELADPFRSEQLRARVDELLDTDLPGIPELSPYLHEFTALSDSPSCEQVAAPSGERCVMINWPTLEHYGQTMLRIVAMQRRPYNFTPVPAIQRLLIDLPGLSDADALEPESLLREPALPSHTVPRAYQVPGDLGPLPGLGRAAHDDSANYDSPSGGGRKSGCMGFCSSSPGTTTTTGSSTPYDGEGKKKWWPGCIGGTRHKRANRERDVRVAAQLDQGLRGPGGVPAMMYGV